MEQSILKSIMIRMGTDPNDESEASYIVDVIQAINGAILGLTQAGVGPSDGFRIESAEEVWEDLLGTTKLLESAKDYVYLRCRLVFDPPTAGVSESFKSQADEALWRCKHSVEQLITS